MRRILLWAILLATSFTLKAQNKPYDAPGNLNPLLPGYFADPTIRKFGDTFYIYTTTDGTGNGYGPAQVWASKDFQNWKNVVMNWPTTEVVWAPDVVQQPNGKYRYYYCEPCMIHVGESDSPLGPWHNILGKDDAVMVPDRFVYNAITLDPQLFRDDDGEEYLYFGTWGIYENFGCGVAKLNRNWKEGDGQESFFTEKKLILNTEIKDFFEAPFVFKKDGVYYFTYSSGSCHDDTYRVQYATATHPMGPYTYKGCILKTNQDGSVHGPGHHSIFVDGQDYYIVYHRHNNPHSLHGFHRQVCIDRISFDAQGNIMPITPTHEGPTKDGHMALALPSKKLAPNLAFGAQATASSYYSEAFKPAYATDENNGTLWRAAHTPWDKEGGHNDEWITLDLGKETKFNQVWTQFENATFFYQYRIETSVDGKLWKPFADRTSNTQAGSPMIDEKEDDVKARYLRITVTDTQKNGHFAGIWNVKVFRATKGNNPKLLLPDTEDMDLQAVEKGYPWLHTPDVSAETRQEMLLNKGVLLDISADYNHQPDYMKDTKIEPRSGKYAFYLNGRKPINTGIRLPQYMTYNAPYTIEAWLLNTQLGPLETVISLSSSHSDLATTEFRNGTDRSNGLVAHNGSFENSGNTRAVSETAGKWQHWVLTYDGYMERIYLNGELLQEKNNFIMMRPQGQIMIGGSGDGSNAFSGYIHSLKVLSRSVTAQEVKSFYNTPSVAPSVSKQEFHPTIHAVKTTPETVQVELLDEKGEPLNTGLYRYRYGIATSQKDLKLGEATDLASLTLSCPKGKTKVFVQITDEDGKSIDLPLLQRDITDPSTTFKLTEHRELIRLSNNKGEHFNDNPVENGMTTLTEAEGDFVITAHFVDIDGSKRHSTPAYNEGGLIMSDGQTSVHIGVFPAYDCGNMLTYLTRRGRPQYPNGKGWQYDPWMQLQRIGNKVYARTSLDGIHWVENDGSPVTIPANTGKMHVGLYQTTYNNNQSWVEMDQIRIWKK